MNALEKRSFGRVVDDLDLRPGHDQAEGVRRLAAARTRHARVIAVTSGKGGVGKTNIAVNLAIGIARRGKRVVLVDLDLGLANADILLDVTPRHNLSQVLVGRKTIEEVMVPAAGGVRLVPGASGVERLANLSDVERSSLLASFEALHGDADYIIFDTGAGISRNTTAFLAAADDIIVVTVPEPPAVVDAYAVIKMLSQEPDPGDLFVLMNQVSGRDEAERFAQGISVTANKLLNVFVDKLGYVVSDPRVGQAVRRRRPFILEYPGSPASLCIGAVAQRVSMSTPRAASAGRPGFLKRLFSAIAGR